MIVSRRTSLIFLNLIILTFSCSDLCSSDTRKKVILVGRETQQGSGDKVPAARRISHVLIFALFGDRFSLD